MGKKARNKAEKAAQEVKEQKKLNASAAATTAPTGGVKDTAKDAPKPADAGKGTPSVKQKDTGAPAKLTTDAPKQPATANAPEVKDAKAQSDRDRAATARNAHAGTTGSVKQQDAKAAAARAQGNAPTSAPKPADATQVKSTPTTPAKEPVAKQPGADSTKAAPKEDPKKFESAKVHRKADPKVVEPTSVPTEKVEPRESKKVERIQPEHPVETRRVESAEPEPEADSKSESEHEPERHRENAREDVAERDNTEQVRLTNRKQNTSGDTRTDVATVDTRHPDAKKMKRTKGDGRAPEPRAYPAAGWVANIIGLLLLVLAGLAIWDLWAHYSKGGAKPILTPAAEQASQWTMQSWMIPAGVVSIILGLILLVLALRPRTRTHRALNSDVSAWMRPVDIARMTTANAERVPGVMKAHTVVTESKVNLSVVGDVADDTLIQRVSNEVAPQLRQVASSPELKIKVQNPGGNQ